MSGIINTEELTGEVMILYGNSGIGKTTLLLQMFPSKSVFGNITDMHLLNRCESGFQTVIDIGLKDEAFKKADELWKNFNINCTMMEIKIDIITKKHKGE